MIAGLRALFGRSGEDRAVRFLRSGGYRIVARNVAFKTGEIDIVALESRTKTLCFVEVKTWDNGAAESAWESVTPDKQRKIRRTAEWYLLRKKPDYEACRFDVVAVLRMPDGRMTIEHRKNCF